MFLNNNKTSVRGLHLCLLCALALILVLAFNTVAGLLPKRMTSIDISPDKKYSVSDTAKRAFSKIDEEITVSLFVYGGKDALSEEGLHVSTYLERLCEYSKFATFQIVDLQAHAELAETATNNSVVVASNKRERVISVDSFFYLYMEGLGKVTPEQAQLYYSYYGDAVSFAYLFDGEDQMLNALSYVTAKTLPKIYALSGHNETALPDDLVATFSNGNMDTSQLTLTEAGIPSDCSILLVNLPTTDLSATEALLLADYMGRGGKLILITAVSTPPVLPNLLGIAQTYGLEAMDGIVIEPNSNYYYQAPYYLLPGVGGTDETDASGRTMLPFAHSIDIQDSMPEGVKAISLLVTSAEAYIIPADASSLEKPADQAAKMHNVGVIAKAQNGSSLLWISSEGITDANANSYVSGGNYSFLSSITSWMCDAPKATMGTPVALSVEFLTVPTSSAAVLSILLIIVIPLTIGIGGFVYWLRRRKK